VIYLKGDEDKCKVSPFVETKKFIDGKVFFTCIKKNSTSFYQNLQMPKLNQVGW